MSGRDLRMRIDEAASAVLRELHWQTWCEVNPAAAALAMPAIEAVIEAETRNRARVAKTIHGVHVL